MAVNRFAIGQRVRVVKVGNWNGTPPNTVMLMKLIGCPFGVVVTEYDGDTIAVEIDDRRIGVLQFLPDELAVLDNTSGDSVE